MSLFNTDGSRALHTKAGDAETLAIGATEIRLLADADDTGGVVNANRTLIAPGGTGAPPHFHTSSAELFFVLGGSLRTLAGEQVLTLDEGDFLMVPRGMPHAFEAVDGVAADVLILFTPAIPQRFEYFRLGERVVKGQASPQEILASQDRFDNHFIDSPHWLNTAGRGRS